MSFITIEFLLFLLCLIIIYFLVPRKWQWIVLLAGNFYFYISAGAKAVLFILFTSLCAWYTAILLEKINARYKRLRETACSTREDKQRNRQLCTAEKKKLMALSLAVNFGIWIVLKYSAFLISNLDLFLEKFKLPIIPVPEFLLPLGISFYTFIAMGYCIDIYRGKYQAEKNAGKFILFISFFPHIVQGPFSRFDSLSGSLFEEHTFSFDRMCQGGLRILWGMFKKLVVANKISIVVDSIYGDISTYNGMFIWVAIILFVIELYADFSGYMDIAIGASRILGIKLQENFRQPFFAKSMEEFWRRWHITLGAWFRDYVFYSISMSKKVQNFGRKCKNVVGASTGRLIPSYIALFFVWTATGLWHGADWTFLVWGLMNLLVIAVSMQLQGVYAKVRGYLRIRAESRLWQLFQIVRTFMLFSFMEMFSEAESIGKAAAMCRSMFTFEHWTYIKNPMLFFPALDVIDLAVIVIGVLLMLAVDIMKEKETGIFRILGKIPCVLRYAGYASVLYAIILFGEIGGGMSGGFMYAQF